MRKAIARIMYELTDELVITSAGTISREVFAHRDRPENLYLMGALGCTLGVGIGLALNIGRQVIVIAGDGDILMSLGTLVLMNKLNLSNLRLCIVDNNRYVATGCQPTCSDAVDFHKIADCHVFNVPSEKSDAPRITLTPLEVQERFYNAINSV